MSAVLHTLDPLHVAAKILMAAIVQVLSECWTAFTAALLLRIRVCLEGSELPFNSAAANN